MQIRAGHDAQEIYRKLNRRLLPYVYFRLRFDATDWNVKSRITSPGFDAQTPDPDHDYSPLPTFYLFERKHVLGTYLLTLVPGFPLRQNLEPFLAMSPMAFYYAYLLLFYFVLSKVIKESGPLLRFGTGVVFLVCQAPAVWLFRAKKWWWGLAYIGFGLIAGYCAIYISTIFFAFAVGYS
jgi:hypothetical protein